MKKTGSINKRKCLNCHCVYKREGDKFRFSDNDDEYCKYMGCCDKKCMKELPKDNQTELYLSSMLKYYWDLKEQ